LVEEHLTKLIDTLFNLLKVPHLPWMSTSVTQQGAVCITPKTPTTSGIMLTQTDIGGNNVSDQGTPSNEITELIPRNIEETPKHISSDAATTRNVPSNEETPRCTQVTEPMPEDTTNKVTTSNKETLKNCKRKRQQPSYHELNVKRTKVAVNSKIKKKKLIE